MSFLSHFCHGSESGRFGPSNEDMALSVRFHNSKKEVEVKGFESIMASMNRNTRVLMLATF